MSRVRVFRLGMAVLVVALGFAWMADTADAGRRGRRACRGYDACCYGVGWGGYGAAWGGYDACGTACQVGYGTAFGGYDACCPTGWRGRRAAWGGYSSAWGGYSSACDPCGGTAFLPSAGYTTAFGGVITSDSGACCQPSGVTQGAPQTFEGAPQPAPEDQPPPPPPPEKERQPPPPPAPENGNGNGQ